MNSNSELNLRNISKTNFRPTLKADQINDFLKSKLGMQNRYDPARLAIAYSMSQPLPISIDKDIDDDQGKQIAGGTLFGEELLPAWIAMLVENLESDNITAEKIQDLVKFHWTRGCLLLEKIWKSFEEDKNKDTFNEFILYLAEASGLPQVGSEPLLLDGDDNSTISAGAISLRLGELGVDVKTNKEVRWHLNGKGSPHGAFMGATGTGKSRIALNMISQIRQYSNVPMLIFDFAKGDIANNFGFVNHIGATVISCPDKSPVPLDVLHIPVLSKNSINNAAMRFRESFIRIPKNKTGAVQLDDLRDAAKTVFQKDTGPFKIEDIQKELLAIYNQSGKNSDIITSTFNDLMQWNLFEPKLSPSKFFKKSWVIDVHEATETAQRMVVFLMLDALYSYIKSLPDSDLDNDGNRKLEFVLVIDEARKVLKFGQESLISLIRESRSKGMSIFLISQSPEDFDTDADNFLEQIGLTACFSSKGKSSKVLKACLGKNVDLASLPLGVAAVKISGDEEMRQVKVWN